MAKNVRYFVNLYGSEQALHAARDLGVDITPPNEDRAPARANVVGALVTATAIDALLEAGLEVHILSSTDQLPELEVLDDAAAFLEAVTGRQYT